MRRGRRRRRRREKRRGKTKTRRRRRRPPRPSVGVDASRARASPIRAGGHSPPDARLASAGGGHRAGTRHRDRCRAVDATTARMVVQRARVAGLPRSPPRRTARCAPHPRSPQRPSARGGGSRLPDAARSAEPSTGQISASSLFGRTIFDRLAVRTSARGLQISLSNRPRVLGTGGRDASNREP